MKHFYFARIIKTVITCIAILTYHQILRAQCAGNLITDGSFNSPIGEAITAPGWTPFSTPDVNDATDPLHTTPCYIWTGTPLSSADGGTWQDIYGSEAISQTVTVTPGECYTLCFQYAAQGIDCSGTIYADPVGVVVLINGVAMFTTPNDSTQYTWENACYSFTPVTATVTIQFTPASQEYVGMDGVCLLPCSANPLQSTVTAISASCHGFCNGSASTAAANGTPPYQYLWQPTGDTTATDSNLCAGTYIVTITDAALATVIDTVIVTEPANFTVSITADTNLICPNDSAQICVDSSFASYLWNSGQTNSCISTQLAGNYYVTATDNNSCTAESNHISITVHSPPPVSISVNGDTLTAYNAVTYQWYLDGNPIPGATSQSNIAILGGSYSVAVTDTNGCGAVSTTVVISGMNDLSDENEIRVYPNPLTVGSWQLAVGKELLESKLEVFDAGGKSVFLSNIENRKTNIELIVEKGIYLMKIHSAKNIFVKKLIRL